MASRGAAAAARAARAAAAAGAASGAASSGDTSGAASGAAARAGAAMGAASNASSSGNAWAATYDAAYASSVGEQLLTPLRYAPPRRLRRQDIIYVCERTLRCLRAKLMKKEEVTQDMVGLLWCGSPGSPGDLFLVPVDLAVLPDKGKSFWDLCGKLGPARAADAILRAREHFLRTTAEVPLNALWRPIPACTISCEYQELIREDLEELRAVHVADLEEPRAAPLVDLEEPRAVPLVDLEELRAVPLVDLEGPRPAPLVDLAEPRAVDQESADLWSGLFAPDAGPVDLVEPEPRPGQPSCKRHKTG